MKTEPFYNTTHLSGDVLLTEVSNAESLENKVKKVFEDEQKHAFTWSEVWVKLGMQATNESSVKRSITNLLNKGVLIKTTMLKKSFYGKSAHLYIWNFQK